ncbi:MAG: hypothetical protein M3170_01635 [Candidatus Dormibacteraeota bacterium]|nr:hypothetical protein [Candidatus Dormibacteraeota bacterium]
MSESGMAPSPNTLLRTRRLEAEWGRLDLVAKLEMLADELGDPRPQVEENLVGKWERGDRTPGPYYAPRLCLVFDATPEEIGLRSTPRLLAELHRLTERRMKRRQFLVRSLAAGSVLVAGSNPSLVMLRDAGLPGLIEPGALHIVPRQLDEALLDEVHRRVILCMEQWDRHPPDALLPAVASYVDQLRGALEVGPTPALALRIRTIASEAAAFAGLLGWFMQRRLVAEAYLSIADQLAEQAGHMLVQAIVMTIRADFHSRVQAGRREGSAISRSFLEAGQALLGPVPSVFRAWVLQRQAEEYAAIGDERLCQRCLELADTAFSAVDVPPPGMFAHWSWDMHAAFRGNCEQLLGQYRLSVETLTGVLVRIDPSASSNRAALQADIAAAAAQQGETEQACALLMQSLAVAVRSGLRERVKRIAGIRTAYLPPAGHEPTVRELDEQLKAFGWR